jgi:hypothetical protein
MVSQEEPTLFFYLALENRLRTFLVEVDSDLSGNVSTQMQS